MSNKIDPFDTPKDFYTQDHERTEMFKLTENDLSWLKETQNQIEEDPESSGSVEHIANTLELFVQFWLENSDKTFIDAATMFDNLNKGI